MAPGLPATVLMPCALSPITTCARISLFLSPRWPAKSSSVDRPSALLTTVTARSSPPSSRQLRTWPVYSARNCATLSAPTGLLRWTMTPTPSSAMVCAIRSPSSGLSARETRPISAKPVRASVTPREEPPLCTSMRTPAFRVSKRLPISRASGATVLEPVRLRREAAARAGADDNSSHAAAAVSARSRLRMPGLASLLEGAAFSSRLLRRWRRPLSQRASHCRSLRTIRSGG